MSLADVVKALNTGHRAACARYRTKNLEKCRAAVRRSKLKAKRRRS